MNCFSSRPNLGANERAGGFSDGWYDSVGTGYALDARDRALINSRAAMLPVGTSIVGARISFFDADGVSVGRSRPHRLALNGSETGQADDPRLALMYSCYGFNVTNELQLYIQNIPDARTANGGYVSIASWENKVRDYVHQKVAGQGYGFFGFDQNQSKFGIESISAAGNMVTSNAHDFTEGQYLRILKTVPTTRTKFRTDPNGWLVTAAPDAFHLTVQGWNFGECTGGYIQRWAKLFVSPQLNDEEVLNPLVCTKKIGRPFFGYRGRASNRV